MSVSPNKPLRDRLAGWGLAAHAALLAGVLASTWLVVAPLALILAGAPGLIAAAIGALVCLVGAQLALALAALFQGPSAALYALAVGMLARTVVPMLLGVALHLAVPALAAAGMIFYLLGFYVVALSVETTLLIAKLPPTTSRKTA